MRGWRELEARQLGPEAWEVGSRCWRAEQPVGTRAEGFVSPIELLLSEPNRIVLFCGGSEVYMYRVKY